MGVVRSNFFICVPIMCTANDVASDDWIQLFEVMISSTRCLNPECDHRATPRFIVSCQTKLERHYIPIRDTLSKIGGSDSKALETWHRFAESVGISESLLLAKWIREVQC